VARGRLGLARNAPGIQPNYGLGCVEVKADAHFECVRFIFRRLGFMMRTVSL